MRRPPRSIQVLASVLAAVLVLLPVGTLAATCLSGGDMESAGASASPGSSGPVIEVVAHHCPHDAVAGEQDPAVRLERSDRPPAESPLAFLRTGGSQTAVEVLSPATARLRISPSPPPEGHPSSLRTVVLLV